MILLLSPRQNAFDITNRAQKFEKKEITWGKREVNK